MRPLPATPLWILLMLPSFGDPNLAAPARAEGLRPQSLEQQQAEQQQAEQPQVEQQRAAEATAPRIGAMVGNRPPLVIAHRGASGYRPEHTLAAYRLAIRQGADFIEPDLVVTRDGVLIARHENELSGTTDVAERPEFADRRTTKRVGGIEIRGWFSEDFTLREIKTLRAKERIPAVRPQNTQFDRQLAIPTLEEIIDLVRRVERYTGRRVGIYPETKQPTYFAHEGRHLDPQTGKLGPPIRVSLGERLIRTLVAKRFTDPGRVMIQSFEVANLMELQRTIMPRYGVRLPLIQLYGDLSRRPRPDQHFARPYDIGYHVRSTGGDPARLRAIYGELPDHLPGGISGETCFADLARAEVLTYLARTYAAGVGPSKSSLLPRPGGEVHTLLPEARRLGLEVHPYTLRADPAFLSTTPDGSPRSIEQEVVDWLEQGATGFFIDQPDAGVRGRARWLELREKTPAEAPR